MATDAMYALAFRYKKEKLWRNLMDNEVFAVRFSDGEIGYCCVMGMRGEHNALSVYVGAEGFATYRRLALEAYSEPWDDGFGPFDTAPMEQECLQCVLGNKDDLDPMDVERVRNYARRNHIALRGKNCFPYFVKYRPFRLVWTMDDPVDQRRICEALAAAVELPALLRSEGKDGIGMVLFDEQTQFLPLLEEQDGAYILRQAPVPPLEPQVFPAPKLTNDVTLARLRRLKKRGIMECGILFLPTPLQDDDYLDSLQEVLEDGDEDEDDAKQNNLFVFDRDSVAAAPEEAEESEELELDGNEPAPWFPAMVVALRIESGEQDVTMPVLDYEASATELLNQFAERIIAYGKRPREIRVPNERSYALLEDLCQKTGIVLTLEAEVYELEEMVQDLLPFLFEGDDDDEDEDDLFDWFDPDPRFLTELDEEDEDEDEESEDDASGLPREMMEEFASLLFEALMKLSDKELKKMPKNLREDLKALGLMGMLPDDLAKRLTKIF